MRFSYFVMKRVAGVQFFFSGTLYKRLQSMDLGLFTDHLWRLAFDTGHISRHVQLCLSLDTEILETPLRTKSTRLPGAATHWSFVLCRPSRVRLGLTELRAGQSELGLTDSDWRPHRRFDRGYEYTLLSHQSSLPPHPPVRNVESEFLHVAWKSHTKNKLGGAQWTGRKVKEM